VLPVYVGFPSIAFLSTPIFIGQFSNSIQFREDNPTHSSRSFFKFLAAPNLDT
jgi:hypothetical protein